MCQRKRKQMNGGSGNCFYGPRIPWGFSTMPTALAALESIPPTTALHSQSAVYLSTSTNPANHPGFILSAIFAQRSRHAPRHCCFFSKWKVVGKKDKRERMMGEFLPIPKKGTRRHIFAIVQNEGKEPEQLWRIVFLKDRIMRCMCDGTWKDGCKERKKRAGFASWHKNNRSSGLIWLLPSTLRLEEGGCCFSVV